VCVPYIYRYLAHLLADRLEVSNSNRSIPGEADTIDALRIAGSPGTWGGKDESKRAKGSSAGGS